MSGTETKDRPVLLALKSTRPRTLRGLFGVVSNALPLVLSVLFLVMVLGWTIAPELFVFGRDPLVGSSTGLRPPGLSGFPLGSDRLGRDLYTRVVFGARSTILAAAFAVSIGFAIGCLIGLISGYIGGIFDTVVMRGIDVLLSLPSLLTAMVILASLGSGTANAAIAVGIALIGTFARLMRAEVRAVKSSDYVQAAFLQGSSSIRVLSRHIVPNSSRSAVALSALEFGTATLAISALSFLGFGAAPPAAEWGLMVAEGRNTLATSPWVALVPGLAISLVVLSVNQIGRMLSTRREDA